MKKIACLLLSFLAVLSSFTVSLAVNDSEQNWQDEYYNIINITKVSEDTNFVLIDTDYDKVPELFCGDNNFITAFSFKNHSVTKLYETYNVPIEYIANIKTFYNPASSMTEFVGQSEKNGTIISYKLNFSQNEVSLTEIDVQTAESFFSSASLVPLSISVLDSEEINSAEDRNFAITDFLNRHTLFLSLSNDTESFSCTVREEIKKSVSDGDFLSFDKISNLNSNALFVQFYEISDNTSLDIPQNKVFACILKNEEAVRIFKDEQEIDTEYVFGLLSEEHKASNIFVDYGKASSFLNFDEHINYLNNLVSESGSIANENGKKEILKYVEYAVNKSSRTKLKPKKNVYTIDSYAVSMITEYAIGAMEKMVAVCESGKIAKNPTLTNVPELVCSEIDLSNPVRIEFEAGVAKSLAGVSGLKIMLDDCHGIYLPTENILKLENSTDSFCIEIKHKPGKISVTFADRNNNIINNLITTVSFILPAESRFSSVIRTTDGGTKIIGGEFDKLNNAVRFKTSVSGTYEVIKSDFIINDIQSLSEKDQEAVGLSVSLGALSLENNKFKPTNHISKNEFYKALITMFYEVNPLASSSFSDVSEDSKYFRYIATAEESGLILNSQNAEFYGNDDISREEVVALCGRTLVKSGKFTYPEKGNENLSYFDIGRISNETQADIAVALSAGIIKPTKYFSPQKKLSKKDCAILFYNTYMALFESPSVTTSSNIQKKATQPAESKTDWELYAALIILSAIFLLFVGYIIRKLVKRRKRLLTLKKENLSHKEKNDE